MDGNGETTTVDVAATCDERSRQWTALVAEQEGSGLSAAEFCRQRQVAVWKFYCWRQRIRGGTEACSLARLSRVSLSRSITDYRGCAGLSTEEDGG